MNEQNLIVPTSSQARENGRKGGLKSAEAKRKRKAMRETFEIILSMPLRKGKSTDIENIRSYVEMRGKNITIQDAINFSIIKKAMSGDVRAAEFIRDTIGEAPTNMIDLNADADLNICIDYGDEDEPDS